MALQLRFEDLPVGWIRQSPQLLAQASGLVAVMVVPLPCQEGQDPNSYYVKARELFEQLTSIGLTPKFFHGPSLSSDLPEEAFLEAYDLFDTNGTIPALHVALWGSALGFVYAVLPSPPSNSGSGLAGAPNGGISRQDNGRNIMYPPLQNNASGTAPPPGDDRRGQILRRYEHPVYPKYHGNPKVQDNWPSNVPPEANTSLWLDGLPPTIKVCDIFSQIRGAGAVKQLHINKPTDANPIYAAAKLVFFTRQGAEALMEASQEGRFMVCSTVPRVTWNRHFTAEDPPNGRSRVLVIRGPDKIVSRRFLEAFWNSRMWWDVDVVLEAPPGAVPSGEHAICYQFGSWRCQADKAKKEIERTFPKVVVVYGDDPCA